MSQDFHSLVAYFIDFMQLDEDLVLLGVRAGAGNSALKHLDRIDSSRGSVCAFEDYSSSF